MNNPPVISIWLLPDVPIALLNAAQPRTLDDVNYVAFVPNNFPEDDIPWSWHNGNYGDLGWCDEYEVLGQGTLFIFRHA